jgi:hypothetical protein
MQAWQISGEYGIDKLRKVEPPEPALRLSSAVGDRIGW